MATKKGLMDRVSSWSAQGKDCKAQTQPLEPPKLKVLVEVEMGLKLTHVMDMFLLAFQGKSSDLVLMVLDASKSEGHRQIMTNIGRFTEG
ncbi:hypothetical protein YC2023_122468 [Brassica napus]